jgi:para-aminobenzoate synthetase
MKTLIVDHDDSFTYNLYQLAGKLTGASPAVVRSNELTWEQFLTLTPDIVILSPGPGRPDNPRDFGIGRRILLEGNVPVLGVCLGLQGVGSVFGGTIVHAPEPVHGRTSAIYHDGSGLFAGIPQGFLAVRYHSLMLAKVIPSCLRVTASTADNLVMGLEHLDKPIWAVQFHPESVATEHGEQILRNFIEMAGGRPTPSSAVTTAAPQPETTWKTFSRRLDAYPSSEDTFCALFGSACPAFWLDSSDGDPRRSRFSFMGTGSLIPDVSVFRYLKNELRDRHCLAPELPFDFNGGFVGYLGYELKAECGGEPAHKSPYPDSRFIFVDRFLAFDHQELCLYLVYSGTTSDSAEATAWLDEMGKTLASGIPHADLPKAADGAAVYLEQDRDEYLASIAVCLQRIRDGESYEICLTNRMKAETQMDPLDYYRVLRRLNPAPYSAFLRFQELAVACSSPERFLKIDRARNAESRPIKGTLGRSSDPAEDEQLREALRNGVKTRAENLMIVDLLRNDLGRVCEIGSVHVPQMMEVETYANLHQLVSTVRGRLRGDVSVIDCIRSAFPGGSMTGAPKIRTMEIIDQLERSARGVYSGTIGFLGLNGTADLNIVIRTAVFAGNEVSIGIGGAIVALSDPEAEFEEAVLKGQRLLDALNGYRATSGLPEKSYRESMVAPTRPERRLP